MNQKNVEDIDFATDELLESIFKEALDWGGAELVYFISSALEDEEVEIPEETLEFIETLKGQEYLLNELIRKFVVRYLDREEREHES